MFKRGLNCLMYSISLTRQSNLLLRSCKYDFGYCMGKLVYEVRNPVIGSHDDHLTNGRRTRPFYKESTILCQKLSLFIYLFIYFLVKKGMRQISRTVRLGLSLRPSCFLVLIVWRKEDIRLISVSPARYNSRVFIDRNLPKNKQNFVPRIYIACFLGEELQPRRISMGLLHA